jgi:hypothetical protein
MFKEYDSFLSIYTTISKTPEANLVHGVFVRN